MGTAYYGDLEIYGNENIKAVLQEAHLRLSSISGANSQYEITVIKKVFFGSITADTKGMLGCAGLVLEEFFMCDGKKNLQYVICFNTSNGYPDEFAKYLLNYLKVIDPNVKIYLDCIGDGIYKLLQWIKPDL